ncbi:chitin synthase-domain-containing protein [Mycena galopus ATCC 62051]|nr:chitin synthase-domain-containing protein [Mycena galopus ATCC 62051]
MAALLDILGADPDLDPEPFSFLSLGEGAKQHNMGKVYSGLYECKGHIVPYLVVAKVRKPTERLRPGNRGKCDSQMLLMHFLNKVHCIVLFACLPIQLPRPSGQKLTLKIGPRPLLPLHRPLPAVPGTRARPPTWRELAPAAHIHFLWPAGKNGSWIHFPSAPGRRKDERVGHGCGQENGSTRGQGNRHGNGHTSGLTSTVPQKRKLGMSSGGGGNGGHGGSKAALPFSLSPVIFRLGLIFLVLDRAHEHVDTRQHGADASTQGIWARGSHYGFVSILRLRTPGSSSAAGGGMGIHLPHRTLSSSALSRQRARRQISPLEYTLACVPSALRGALGDSTYTSCSVSPAAAPTFCRGGVMHMRVGARPGGAQPAQWPG